MNHPILICYPTVSNLSLNKQVEGKEARIITALSRYTPLVRSTSPGEELPDIRHLSGVFFSLCEDNYSNTCNEWKGERYFLVIYYREVATDAELLLVNAHFSQFIRENQENPGAKRRICTRSTRNVIEKKMLEPVPVSYCHGGSVVEAQTVPTICM